MKSPMIDIVPIRPAVCSDAAITLDVLVRITPPTPRVAPERPTLNLGLVLDRSGSMSGRNKIHFARNAAAFAVQQLLPSDRISVTVFDNDVETIVPSTLAHDRARIIDSIQRIEPRGSTALHDGWREGGKQVGSNLVAGGLNRVLLLSDGLANVGVTEPDAIANDVHRLAREGVSTSTLGVGDDYNEDLLEAMAKSGDGNYYYIRDARQLEDIFQTELRGLMAMFGTGATLAVEPQEGVQVADVLNEMERLPTGELKLPNLIAGMPIVVVIRLNVAPRHVESELVRLRLGWQPPQKKDREHCAAALTLPAIDAASWAMLAPVLDVHEKATLLLIARLKKLATRCLEHDDRAGCQAALAEAQKLLDSLPDSPDRHTEAEALRQLEADLESGTMGAFCKNAKFQAHQRRTSRSY